MPPRSPRLGQKVSIYFIKSQIKVNTVLRSFPLFLNAQIRTPWIGSIAVSNVRDTSFELSAPKKPPEPPLPGVCEQTLPAVTYWNIYQYLDRSVAAARHWAGMLISPENLPLGLLTQGSSDDNFLTASSCNYTMIFGKKNTTETSRQAHEAFHA